MMLRNLEIKKILLFLLAVFLIAGPGSNSMVSAADSRGFDAGKEISLTFFHFNDLHGRINKLSKIAWLVKQEKKVNPNTFLLCAGDNFSGNPVVDQASPKGEPVLKLMNAIHLDAMCVGNHEFDYGIQVLDSFLKRCNFPVVSANMDTKKNLLKQPLPYVELVSEEGLKIAVMGLIQLEPETGIPSTHPERVKGIRFFPEIRTALKFRHLGQKYPLFIALTHIGYSLDKELAEAMGELDIIVGGHTHTTVEHPKETNGVLVTQAGAHGDYLGRIDVKIKNNRIISKSARLIDLKTVTAMEPRIAAMVDAFNRDPALTRQVAVLNQAITGKEALGCLITDILREELKLDVAMQNSGGVRIKNLGPRVRVRDIYQMLPFGNQVICKNLSPAEMRNLFTHDIGRHGKFDLIISGIRVFVKRTPAGKVLALEITDSAGKPLNESRTYRVGFNSYIASSYNFDHKDAGRSMQITSAEVVTDYLKNKKISADYNSISRVVEEIVLPEGDVWLAKSEVMISGGSNPYDGSNSAGNLMADAFRHMTDSDIGIYPSRLVSGRIRIPAGKKIFVRMLKALFRHSEKDRIISGKMSGYDLKKFLLERARYRHNADVQLSGLDCVLNRNSRSRISGLSCTLPDGSEICDSKIYRVALAEYDTLHYYRLSGRLKEPRRTVSTQLDLLKDYLKKVSRLTSEIDEPRVTIVKAR